MAQAGKTPVATRLRWVSSKDPSKLTAFLSALGTRVQIYQIVPQGTKWFLWFVPPDNELIDVSSRDLDK